MTAPDGHASADTASFFQALFDWDFERFVTRRAIKIVYIISVILIALGALGFFISMLAQGGAGVILAIVIVPVAALLYIIWVRIGLEIISVIFKIGEDAAATRRALESR